MSEITYLEAIREALFEEMERDQNVFCLGEDIGAYGGAFKVTEGLLAKYGEQRVIDTPISETAIVGAAAGAAHMGMRPVCEMQFIDFLSSAYSILTNYVATARYRAMLPCPMVVRGPSGGYVRGGPFHSQNPEAAFLHTPGLKIVYPATASDAKGLLKSAIRDEDCVLFFEHKYLYRRIKEEMPAGRPPHADRQGARCSRGKRMSRSSRTRRPYGRRSRRRAAREGRRPVGRGDRPSVAAPDRRRGNRGDGEKDEPGTHCARGYPDGRGCGEITARINETAFEWLDAPVLRITAADVPLPYSPPLEDFVLPQTSESSRACRSWRRYWMAATEPTREASDARPHDVGIASPAAGFLGGGMIAVFVAKVAGLLSAVSRRRDCRRAIGGCMRESAQLSVRWCASCAGIETSEPDPVGERTTNEKQWHV